MQVDSTVSTRWCTHANPITQLSFSDDDTDQSIVYLEPVSGLRAIEDDSFPFEALSDIAEIESWRKEINRPTTHIHKWWAQRLGTVFRAMLIGTFAPAGSDLLDLFYQPVRIPDRTVFDPFMGSGTTLAEAVKLGTKAIGRDINPVAHFLVKCALSSHNRKAILETFHAIKHDVADEVRSFYRATLPDGQIADVLYFFWVKMVDCPNCAAPVDLFGSYIFARHAYPKKVPQVHAICLHCGGINKVHIEDQDVHCSTCRKTFNPHIGPSKGQIATCPLCNHSFSIAKSIRASGKPPTHRMYAKLILLPDGNKAYYPITDEDRALYAKAERILVEHKHAYPIVPIKPGYNTNQVLGYNYRYWHEMFNARQLLCLSILAERIRTISEPVLRDLFTCLFSGTLEFNNMFASYKGEGTGAVRHMFAHHILKPERVPLEANLWGTPKSSGAFSTMFEGRIRRALDYADNPFELRLASVKGGKTEKVYGLSESISTSMAETYHAVNKDARVYLSCGDSGSTDLPDHSVDAVLTDPPFFDNVHYSQLADFFYVWQRHILGTDGFFESDTTRSEYEVQNTDERQFTERLTTVWRESYRVLKDDGLLTFTYHHSRPEGWRCMVQALMDAGFWISAVHPIKAEMSVAIPKLQTKEPIDFDIILVCRKRLCIKMLDKNDNLWQIVTPLAEEQIRRMRASERKLSRNDVRIIVMAQILRQISRLPTMESALHLLNSIHDETEALINSLHAAGNESKNNARTKERT